MRIAKITLPIFITLIGIALSLACGGSGGSEGNTSDTKRNVKVRLAGGKTGDTVNVYTLGGTLTDPGTLIATTTYDNTSGIALVNLTTGSDYRVVISIGGFEVLEALILSADIANVGAIFNLGVVGPASTLEAWQYYYEDRPLAEPDLLLAHKERIVAIATGLMIRSLDDGLAQDLIAWNNVRSTLTNAFKSTAGYSEIATAATAIAQDINFTTMIQPADMSTSMASLFSSLSTKAVDDLFRAVQVGSPAGLLTGTQTSTDLLTNGKAELSLAGALDTKHFAPFTVTEMTSMEDAYLKAYAYFHSAALLDPTNDEANFLSSLMRMLTLTNRTDSKTLSTLNLLGISWKSWSAISDTEDAEKDIDLSNVQYDSSGFPTMSEIGQILDNLTTHEFTPIADSLENISTNFNFKLTKALQGHDVTSDIDFDHTDVQAMLIWIYGIKAKIEYLASYDFNLTGKTDSRTAMKRFLKDLDEAVITGSETYAITSTQGGTSSTVSSIILTVGFFDELYASFPNTNLPEIPLSEGGYLGITSANVYQGSESYGENGVEKNIQINIAFEAGAYKNFTAEIIIHDEDTKSSSKSFVKGTSATGLILDSAHTSIEESDLATLLNSNTTAATIVDPTSMAASKASFKKLIQYTNGVLNDVQSDASNNISRANHLMPDASEIEKGNGIPFSNTDIDGFQAMLTQISAGLDGSTTFNPSILDSDFPSTTINLSPVFTTNIRDLISNTDGTIYTVSDNGETIIDANDAKITSFYQSVLGTTGKTNSQLEDALSDLENSFDIFLDGSQLQYFEVYSGGNSHSGTFFWEPIPGASSYNLYYKSGATVGLTDSKFNTTNTNTSLSSLGISDPDGYSFALSANVNGVETQLYHLSRALFNLAAPHGTLDLSHNTSLKELSIWGGNSSAFALGGLDISGCLNLRTLAVGTQISSLDISNNKRLESLIIQYFTGSTIDFTSNTALEDLVISSSMISSLSLINQTNLDRLGIGNNHNISSLDLRNNLKLSVLGIIGSNISSLIVTNIENLKGNLYSNTNLPLSSITGASAFTELKLSNISSADMSNFTNLNELNITASTLSSINLASNSSLSILSLSSSNVTTLSLVGSGVEEFEAQYTHIGTADFSNTVLKKIYMYYPTTGSFDVNGVFQPDQNVTSISSVTFGSSQVLKNIDICYTSLSSADVSGLTNLVDLNLIHSGLTSINLANNQNLKFLSLENNDLTTLDLSNNSKIEYLYLNSNPKFTQNIVVSGLTNLLEYENYNSSQTAVDVSNNSKLFSLDIAVNSITSLSIGNNPHLFDLRLEANSLTSLDISSNPNLQYISLKNNSFTSTTVDAVLNAMMNFTETPFSKTLIIDGTNAAPSTSGLSNSSTLNTSRNWTITLTSQGV